MNFVAVFYIFAGMNLLLFNLTEEAGSTSNSEIEEISDRTETRERGIANKIGTSDTEITEAERPHTNTEIEEEECSHSKEQEEISKAWNEINVQLNADCRPTNNYKNWAGKQKMHSNFLYRKFSLNQVKYNKHIILE